MYCNSRTKEPWWVRTARLARPAWWLHGSSACVRWSCSRSDLSFGDLWRPGSDPRQGEGCQSQWWVATPGLSMSILHCGYHGAPYWLSRHYLLCYWTSSLQLPGETLSSLQSRLYDVLEDANKGPDVACIGCDASICLPSQEEDTCCRWDPCSSRATRPLWNHAFFVTWDIWDPDLVGVIYFLSHKGIILLLLFNGYITVPYGSRKSSLEHP